MARKKINNKMVICEQKNRRPYGVKLYLETPKHNKFYIDGECSLILSSDVIVALKPIKGKIHEHGVKWEIVVDGFATAGEAESFGLKVALAFTWSSINVGISNRLIYKTPLPCKVYDRTAPYRSGMSSSGVISILTPLELIIAPIDKIVKSKKSMDPLLLIATEIFSAASLETTERSKFVSLVSSIEPLAKQEKYKSEDLDTLVENFREQIGSSSLAEPLRNSLQGRIEQLKTESVSSAIRRLIKDKFPDNKEYLEIIEEAYGIRSNILHNGLTDPDLQYKTIKVTKIIKELIGIFVEEYLCNK